ncbi:hypothetical protein GOP47_0000693 [Adiantum capillus-veneris]|nr:hypothetical protein GOP47_0000693 [Adiantum capillus-veneris]
MVLSIREFAFHVLNANLLWPGTLSFAEWLVVHQHMLGGQKVLELGSGTGALAIFLKKAFSTNITTSDYDDEVIEENIAFNCRANGLAKLPHIRHTWGNTFPASEESFDLILASDILLYVKQYPNLIKTLLFLLKACAPPEDVLISSLQPGIASNKSKEVMKHSSSDFQLPKPCFLMSWRRRIPKEDEAAFFNGCKDEGLCVQHLGSRVYCIYKAKEKLSVA